MIRNVITNLLALAVLLLTMFSCEIAEKEEGAPELPPYESLAVDFSGFTTESKSTGNQLTDTTYLNYSSAALTVFAWNVVLTGTLAVPVASFYQAVNQKAIFIGDNTWQWAYDVKGFAANYTARLTGQVTSGTVIWEMYITRSGIGAYPEFKWFEGVSQLDGTNGQWTLYHSYETQEAILNIDWEKSGDEIGNIKYTYVRETSNGDEKQLSINSYLEYGLTDTELDAFYNIHYTTRNIESEGFLDVNIEWSTTLFNGHIKAAHYFQDTEWHCWDSFGIDVNCE